MQTNKKKKKQSKVKAKLGLELIMYTDGSKRQGSLEVI